MRAWLCGLVVTMVVGCNFGDRALPCGASGADCLEPAPDAAPATCKRDGDCPLGNVCPSGMCVPGCHTSRDCPSGQDCSPQGMCLGGMPDGGKEAHDAGPPDGRGCTLQKVNLLANPGFDQGNVSWSQSSNPAGDQVIVNSGSNVQPQSGNYLVWLGGMTSQQEEIEQTVAVPSDAIGLSVRGMIWIVTGENGVTFADSSNIELQDALTNNVLRTYSNLEATTGWTAFEYGFATGALEAGKSVTLRLTANNSAANPTSFYYDSLALEATVCR
jgi:hypothetical protein